MAKETGPESKGAGQDDPLYKAWLSNGQEHLGRVFGRRLADVLVALAITLLVMLAVSFVYGIVWYLNPIFGANDKLSATDRKDLVQGFASVAQAAAVGLAGAVGLVGLFFTWRSLRQSRQSTERTLELTEQGQITERFTRAIDQLGATDDRGKKQLEIRLGGIYALERIDKESPERAYHPTVMEVLTAYVRENSRRADEPPSGSTSASNEAVEQDKGVEQDEEPPVRRPPTDIQAVLDILNRREEDHVPEQHRVRLDLREANLQGANLYRANLSEAFLYGANLSEAFLSGANLQGADLRKLDLRGANLEVANLQEANLQEANLSNADLQEANLSNADLLGARITNEQLAATQALHGATMPNGQKYEDWHKERAGHKENE